MFSITQFNRQRLCSSKFCKKQKTVKIIDLFTSQFFIANTIKERSGHPIGKKHTSVLCYPNHSQFLRNNEKAEKKMAVRVYQWIQVFRAVQAVKKQNLS